MKLIECPNMSDNFNLFLISCTHHGSLLCHEKGISEVQHMVESEYAGVPAESNYIVHHGDAIEAIKVDDPRFSPDASKEPFPLRQAEYRIDKWQPVAHKILAWLLGNHEWKLHLFGNLSQFMANQMKVPYGTFSCRLTYKDKQGRTMFKHYATHGRKSINSTAMDYKHAQSYMELQLKRHLAPMGGDCLLNSKGHVHKLVLNEPMPRLYLVDTGKKIKQTYTRHTGGSFIHKDDRWYVACGSFLKLYGDDVTGDGAMSGYAELFELPPVELGFVVVRVRNQTIEGVELHKL